MAQCDFTNGVAHVDNKQIGALNYFYSSDNYNVIDKQFLDDMDYNSLKSYANELGIKMIGVTKEQLKAKILEKESEEQWLF